MIKKFFFILFILLATFFAIQAQTVYYSQNSYSPEILNNWNSNRTGGGDTPINFTSGDIFVIQNEDTMTNISTWIISGSNSKLWIENGSILQADFLIDLSSETVFQIDDGGKYIQNVSLNMAASIFAGTEIFASNSIIEILTIPISADAPSLPGWGNLIINQTVGTSEFRWEGAIKEVQNDLNVMSTGEGTTEHVLTSDSDIEVNIGGDFIISGNSNFFFLKSWRHCTVNVAGDVIISDDAVLNLSDYMYAGTLNISGNYVTTGNANICCTGSGYTYIIFCNNGFHSWSHNSSVPLGNKINIIVNNGSVLNLQTSLIKNASGSLYVRGEILASPYLIEVYGVLIENGGVLNVGSGGLETTAVVSFIYIENGIMNCFGNVVSDRIWIEDNGLINLNSSTVITNDFRIINENSVLNAGTGQITGLDFWIGSKGTIKIGSPLGINGHILVTGFKIFSEDARYEFIGTSSQVTGSSLPSSVKNLIINNTGGNDDNFVSLSKSTIVTGDLYLNDGLLNLGAMNLILNDTCEIFGTPSVNNMVLADDNGKFRRKISEVGEYLFPIGTSYYDQCEYTPALFNFTGGIFGTGSYVEVISYDNKYNNIPSIAQNYLERYWFVNQVGITDPVFDCSFAYTDEDIVGNESQLYLWQYAEDNWNMHSLTDYQNNTFSHSDITEFELFTGFEYFPDLEINIQGNGNDIPDGDNTPSLSDLTDFGSVCPNSISTNTFTIQNIGINEIIVSDIYLSGDDMSLFSIENISFPITIQNGQSQTFSVSYSPNVFGISNATINIANNDPDEAIYDFAVSGTAEDILYPTITCINNQEVNADDTHTYTVAGTEFDPTETDDNCEVASVINNFNNSTSLDGASLSEGTTIITWTVTDIGGNETQCSFYVFVNAYIEINDLSAKGISIFPNPTNGIFIIETEDNYILTITDISGKIVKEAKINNEQITIDLTDNASGVYFISFKNNNTVKTAKIILE